MVAQNLQIVSKICRHTGVPEFFPHDSWLAPVNFKVLIINSMRILVHVITPDTQNESFGNNFEILCHHSIWLYIRQVFSCFKKHIWLFSSIRDKSQSKCAHTSRRVNTLTCVMNIHVYIFVKYPTSPCMRWTYQTEKKHVQYSRPWNDFNILKDLCIHINV